LTRATVLALLAGLLAAAAIVDLAVLAAAGAARRAATADDSGPRTRARRLAWLVGVLGRRAGLVLAPPADLAGRVAAAGLPSHVGVYDVMAVKVGGALVAGLTGLLPAAAAPGRLGPVVALALPVGAFLVPDLWLRRRARQRGRAMADELPEILDLLRVVVEAGLPLSRAMGEVGARRRGLLAGELGRAADRIALGLPREVAMAEWRARCPIPAAGALAVAVGRADRHGAPLAPALTALAADARGDRARRMADRAAKAAPKIQLVIALLLVPAVLLIVAAALIGALT
jgi:tight adherence protein C